MTFEDLEAWQVARQCVRQVYAICRQPELKKDYGLTSQLQRASVSVMANIAEGYERMNPGEKRNFYNIARASCAEVRCLIYIVNDNYSSIETVSLRKELESSGRLISGLIRSVKNK